MSLSFFTSVFACSHIFGKDGCGPHRIYETCSPCLLLLSALFVAPSQLRGLWHISGLRCFQHQDLLPSRVFKGSFTDVGFPTQPPHLVRKLFIDSFLSIFDLSVSSSASDWVRRLFIAWSLGFLRFPQLPTGLGGFSLTHLRFSSSVSHWVRRFFIKLKRLVFILDREVFQPPATHLNAPSTILASTERSNCNVIWSRHH